MDNKQFQTRSHSNGLKFHDTLIEAFEECLCDPNAWKISYSHNNTYYRWYPKHKCEKWTHSESRLCEMSEDYANAANYEIFWINQTTIPPNYEQIRKELDEKNVLKEE